MACCGKPAQIETFANANAGNDVVVRPKFKASQLYRGIVTKRDYGRISSSRLVYMDPRDVIASKFEFVTDWFAEAPTAAQIDEALATPAVSAPVETSLDYVPKVDSAAIALLRARAETADYDALVDMIAFAGVRTWNDKGVEMPNGFDMQQDARELASLIVAIERTLEDEQRKPRVLEIGTGSSAGTSRFLSEVLGWHVTAIDVRRPNYTPSGKYEFVLADAATIDPLTFSDCDFDAVLIDGDHSYLATHELIERWRSHAIILAVHDVAPDALAGNGPLRAFDDFALTAKGNERKNVTRAITDGSRLGWGWLTSKTTSRDVCE